MPRLRGVLPVLTLGTYHPDTLTGPAIWLRCVLAGALPEVTLPEGVPVFYLPGIERVQLRAVRECPEALKPLAELQYRGVFFLQPNGKDWTPAALLAQQGVRLAGDSATQEALGRALSRLADVPLAELRAHGQVTAQVLDALLTPDLVRSLLEWLSDPQRERVRLVAEGSWGAFAAQCRQRFEFDPDQDGPISAAALLGERRGRWAEVWERFLQAPGAYPGLPELLRRAKPPQLLLPHPDSWPQLNEEEELRSRRTRLGHEYFSSRPNISYAGAGCGPSSAGARWQGRSSRCTARCRSPNWLSRKAHKHCWRQFLRGASSTTCPTMWL